jgi:hypothetical protein
MKLVTELRTTPQSVEELRAKYQAVAPLIASTLKEIKDSANDLINDSLDNSINAGVDDVFISQAKLESIAASISKDALRIFNKHKINVFADICNEWTRAGYDVRNDSGVIYIGLGV